jgi:hypothetical protein
MELIPIRAFHEYININLDDFYEMKKETVVINFRKYINNVWLFLVENN